MLQGPPGRVWFPYPPGARGTGPDPDLRQITDYLADIADRISAQLESVVLNTVGFLGIHGLSSSGISSQNFTYGNLPLGGLTQATWVFTNMELDATYLVFYAISAPASAPLVGQTRATTNVVFNFGGVVPAGVFVDLVLLR